MANFSSALKGIQLLTRLISRSSNFALKHFLVINQGVFNEVNRCAKYFPLQSCYAQTSVILLNMVVRRQVVRVFFHRLIMYTLNASERCPGQKSFHGEKLQWTENISISDSWDVYTAIFFFNQLGLQIWRLTVFEFQIAWASNGLIIYHMSLTTDKDFLT